MSAVLAWPLLLTTGVGGIVAYVVGMTLSVMAVHRHRTVARSRHLGFGIAGLSLSVAGPFLIGLLLLLSVLFVFIGPGVLTLKVLHEVGEALQFW